MSYQADLASSGLTRCQKGLEKRRGQRREEKGPEKRRRGQRREGAREEKGPEKARCQRREGAREEKGLEKRGGQRREGAREGPGARRALVPEKSGLRFLLASKLCPCICLQRLAQTWPCLVLKTHHANSVNALLECLPPCCSLYELHSEDSISYFSARVLHG
jgi:hypothetical protein